MKKASAKKNNDDLRTEYDLSQLKGGVRGKYYREATAGTMVLIEGRRWSSTRDLDPKPQAHAQAKDDKGACGSLRDRGCG
ncbi:MAG TPA: hypothetical protein VEW46_09745 [Pyrinomonadaceae bacterium]|nr:hypothetical protein [Pyrinomonadaceae bacterium]